jgi:hypothetical protein
MSIAPDREDNLLAVARACEPLTTFARCDQNAIDRDENVAIAQETARGSALSDVRDARLGAEVPYRATGSVRAKYADALEAEAEVRDHHSVTATARCRRGCPRLLCRSGSRKQTGEQRRRCRNELESAHGHCSPQNQTTWRRAGCPVA